MDALLLLLYVVDPNAAVAVDEGSFVLACVVVVVV
jgi:hypothetical protein